METIMRQVGSCPLPLYDTDLAGAGEAPETVCRADMDIVGVDPRVARACIKVMFPDRFGDCLGDPYVEPTKPKEFLQ